MTKYRQIIITVLSLHCIILLTLVIDHWLTPRFKPHRPLVVRSIASSSPPIRVQKHSPQNAPSPAPAKKITPKKQASSPPVKKIEKISTPSVSTITSPPSAQKRSSSELKVPELILETKSLQASIDLTPSAAEELTSYGSHLVAFFQQNLVLPEIGEVIARITVKTPGQLASIEILDSKNTTNSLWLKNQLPLLELPCFNDFNIKEFTLDFTIAFRNLEHH